MAYGHTALPAINWVYGCKRPFEGEELIRSQLRQANRYRNVLVAIERRRRTNFEQLVLRLCPELQKLETQRNNLTQEIIELRAAMKAENARQRKTVRNPESTRRIKELQAQRQLLRPRIKELRDATYTHPTVKVVDENAAAWVKRARAACGIYWGTYLVREATVKQAIKDARPGLPEFKRFTGQGAVAFQSQQGTSTALLEAGGGNNLVQMHWNEPRNRRGRRRGELWFRIGSDANRRPIWAKASISQHRPFPPDTVIKFGHLHLTKCGTRESWSVRFQLVRESGFVRTGLAAAGRVGVDIGWRRVPGGLRVAYWVGDDGREGQELLPEDFLASKQYVEELRSRRSLEFDAVRQRLATWLQMTSNVPEWLLDRTHSLAQWKSVDRLCWLVKAWAEQRFSVDESIFPVLWRWRGQSLRLKEEESHGQRKLVVRRRQLYREIALRLAQEYRTICVEDFNLQKLLTKPQVEQDAVEAGVTYHSQLAAVGELRMFLAERAADVLRLPAQGTTQHCHMCGAKSNASDKSQLVHTCQSCSAQYDQDRNAALWLLRGGVPEYAIDGA